MDLDDLLLALSQLYIPNSIYTFRRPRSQNFSIAYPIIKCIFTNPSSGKAWKKLIQTCKYFFSKNPIFPVEYLECYVDKKWYADGEIFDITKGITNLWLYDGINIFSGLPTLLSFLRPKIDIFDLLSLDIWNQNMTYHEYQFFTSSGNLKELQLHWCIVCYTDGTLVTFDQLFIKIPKLKYFLMHFEENSLPMFKNDTFKRIAEMLPIFEDFSDFVISGLTEGFDFALITDFLLKNETLKVSLSYNIRLSDAYKIIIENFIAKIIETPPKRIPFIDFLGFENSIYYSDYQKLRSDVKISLEHFFSHIL